MPRTPFLTSTSKMQFLQNLLYKKWKENTQKGKENILILKEHCEMMIESSRPLLLLCFTFFVASCQNSLQTNHVSWCTQCVQ